MTIIKIYNEHEGYSSYLIKHSDGYIEKMTPDQFIEYLLDHYSHNDDCDFYSTSWSDLFYYNLDLHKKLRENLSFFNNKTKKEKESLFNELQIWCIN